MNPNWFENSLCHVHLDMHMPAFPKGALSRFNAQRLIRVLKDAYVECAVVFAKDHFGMSFYPTRYGYPHPKMRGDILGELLAEGARQDISMIVYYSVGWDRKTGDEHPDWIMIDQKGQRVNDDGPYPSLCFNSPYIRKMVIPQVSEIVRRYSFRGFFFDIVFMPDQVCFCPFCRKMFEARYAQPLDSSMIGSMRKELDEFRGETIARFVRDIQWEVKRLNPSLWIGHNGPPQLIPDRRIVDGSDLIVIESQPILPGGHHGHSLRCRAARTLGMPFQGITVRFQEGWGQASLKETVQLKQEFASIAVHGGKVSCGDQMNVDGSLEKGVWRRIREALSFLHERRHLFLGFSANRYLALVGDEKYSFPFPSYEILPQVLGAHKILNEGHFQFDVLTMERLPSRMHDYACLVLPENIPVGEKMRDEITEFVADGGRLILFGNALESFLDRQGRSALIGVQSRGDAPYSIGYLKLRKKHRASLEDMLLYVPARFLQVKPTTAKRVAGFVFPVVERVPRFKEFRAEPPPGKESGYPAVVSNRYRRGSVLYFAAPLFTPYWERGYTWLKHAVVNILTDFLRDAPYRVSAPATVEINLMEKDNVRVLHFVNYHGEKKTAGGYEPISEIPVLHDIPVTVRAVRRPRSVTLEPGGKELAFRYEKGLVSTTLPELHIHAALRIVL